MVDRLGLSARRAATVALVWLLTGANMAAAQTLLESARGSDPSLAKVSSHLLQARALAAAERSAAEIAAAVPGVRLHDGLARVAIRLDSLTPDVVEKLRGAGLLVDSHHEGHARAYGRVDPADLHKLAVLPEVVTIQPMPRHGTRVGAASNQADVTMNSDDVRATFGYDGTGVEVGILSDSFNRTTLGGAVSGGVCNCDTPGSTCATVVTGMNNQTSGDLPASIPILDDCTVIGFCSPSTAIPCATSGDCPGGETCVASGSSNCSSLADEGAAIGELIHDVAPAAGFLFHSAFNSPSDFAEGITELRNCGADLIVDDAFWTQQAFFQDDIIAQAAQAAVAAGVPYVSAAGNDATFGIDELFLDSDPTSGDCNPGGLGKIAPDGSDFHDFGGGDHYAAITIPDDCDIYAELQWSDPFDSIGGGPGAANDFDLFLLDSPTAPADVGPPAFGILDASFSDQASTTCTTMSGDPVEFVSYFNHTGAPQTVYLAVDSCCGGSGERFRIVTLSFLCNTTLAPWDFEDGFDIVGGLPVADPSETPIFVDPQIFGHPAAKDVIAVGATFFREIDTGGTLDPPTTQLDVEPFSSLGGDIPFYFDTDGNDLPGAPELRMKPEVTGPDGTNTTFFGIDIGFDPDTDPNFFGTSAAAPNSAGVAALILDATDLKINPLPLKQLLSQAAIDMEGTGFDPLSGHGFTDALRPIRSLDSSTTPLIDDLEFDLDGGAFFSSPPSPNQRLQANDSIKLLDGDFDGLDGLADTLIFADGFESGDTSAWSN